MRVKKTLVVCPVLLTAVISLAFPGLAGCAGGPKADTVPEGISTYYVRADGDNWNSGLTEDAPFRTLHFAVDAANKSKIKTITVLGTLNAESEGGNSLYPDAVFFIYDTRGAEITIRGREGTGETGQGVLSATGTGKQVLAVFKDSRIRLEHIRIEGGDTEYSGAGICIGERSQVTLGDGTLVQNNRSRSNGGGVAVAGRGTFIMEGGEISGNTTAKGGGGVNVDVSGTFTLKGGEISGNTAEGGGVVLAERGTFTMKGGTISGNTADSGGGGR